LQSQDELARSQLGGTPPTCTQEAKSGWWGAARSLAAAGRGGPQLSPGGSQLPGASGGLPESSHEVAGSAAAMATPQPTGDARHR
jgi:hypothetical protein